MAETKEAKATRMREYNQRPEVKERKREWVRSKREQFSAEEREKVRERERGYDSKRRNTPESRAVKNAKDREYRQSDEAKQKRRTWFREYRKRPDVLARKREQSRDYRRRADVQALQRLKRYGITGDAWNALFDRQGHACGICSCTDPGKRGWNTDHCHETGVVRGILCNRCNIMLGAVGDTLAALRRWAPRADAYLSAAESRIDETLARVPPPEIAK